MINTTIGQLMLNEALPPDMRDYTRVLDKAGMRELFRELEEKHPDQYREVAKRLSDVARDVSYTSGGQSFGLRHLRTPAAATASRTRLNRRIRQIWADPQLSDEQKEEAITQATAEEQRTLATAVLEEAQAAGNPLARQVLSGSRGNKAQLARLVAGDLQYLDHHDEPIPFPVQHGYSEGLAPAEWFAAAFGARKGLIGTKFSTQDGGYFAKQLAQAAHRLMVVAEDADDTDQVSPSLRGYPVSTTDPDNEGARLASAVGDYERNTVLTPKILQDLRNQGVERILVRSPAVGGPLSGVYARDLGVRERRGGTPRGDMVGLAAAQALSERLTQGMLGSKHKGGLGGQHVSSFEHVNQLIQVPKHFKGGAAHSQQDGTVERILEAPAGGKFVRIDGENHYVAPGFEISVAPGDKVEAGDVISEGIPNPAEIVRHKGVGEGRRYFVQTFLDAYRQGGMPAHRRNVELIARGLIDHVEMQDEGDQYVPGDVVSYAQLEHDWEPRDGYRSVGINQAAGKYLERPVLHYSIGTQVRPSVLRDLHDFGVEQVDVHDEPPPFAPVMVRAMANLQHDPDWMARMLGSYQQKSLLTGTHRGHTSDTRGTSFVPALAEGVGFGRNWPQDVPEEPQAIPLKPLPSAK